MHIRARLPSGRTKVSGEEKSAGRMVGAKSPSYVRAVNVREFRQTGMKTRADRVRAESGKNPVDKVNFALLAEARAFAGS